MALYPKSESDRTVRVAELLNVATAMFTATGMAGDDAALLAETLVHSDRRGVHSHGVIRVPDYVAKLARDGVDPKGRPKVVSRRAGAIVIDGGNSMGQIGGSFAMDEAIDAARQYGIAYAALRGSNHCGALDWYTLRAVAAGMIGIAGTNALPTMAPWGGIDKIVGINPLSIAMPGGEGHPFVLDFAFGATAHGKIRVYHQKGANIPEGWAFDADGNPTTDTAKALAGLIQPIGEHKGVALGMAVGMLSSLLSGAAYGTESGNMVEGAIAGVDGQFFVAIDVAAFTDPAGFGARVDAIRQQLYGARKRADVERLYAPGDIEAAFEATAEREGAIILPAQTLSDIAVEAQRLGVDPGELAAYAGNERGAV
jgi:LDH2 family malate/lactate/ureidoglycolate dehydrogenase